MDDELRAIAISRLRAAGASKEDAEDCVQEALLAAWSSIEAGKPPNDLLAWTTVVARRRYIDLIRRERRQTALVSQVHDEQDRTAATPERRTVEREHARWLAARLNALPRRTRAVCQLTAAGADRPTVAERLAMTDRAIESHLTRARRFMRAQATLGWIAASMVAVGRSMRGHATATTAIGTATLMFMVASGPNAARLPDLRREPPQASADQGAAPSQKRVSVPAGTPNRVGAGSSDTAPGLPGPVPHSAPVVRLEVKSPRGQATPPAPIPGVPPDVPLVRPREVLRAVDGSPALVRDSMGPIVAGVAVG